MSSWKLVDLITAVVVVAAIAMVFLGVSGLSRSSSWRPSGVLELPSLRAVDGDTIAVRRDPDGPVVMYLRIWGIDAPEKDTEPGRLAWQALSGFIDGGEIVCEPMGRGGYGRTAVRCRVGRNGPDIARLLVEGGYARDCPAFSGGAYRAFEPLTSRELPRRSSCVPEEDR